MMPLQRDRTRWTRRTPTRSRFLLFFLVGTAGLLLWFPAQSSGVQAAGGTCFPSTTLTITISAQPDIGGIAPTVLETVGTTVQLTGVAESERVLSNCDIDSEDLPFTWHLTYQPPGGAFFDVTNRLQGLATLTPSFTPDQPGTYFAGLSAGGQTGR